jgi:hypothetical protein
MISYSAEFRARAIALMQAGATPPYSLAAGRLTSAKAGSWTSETG